MFALLLTIVHAQDVATVPTGAFEQALGRSSAVHDCLNGRAPGFEAVQMWFDDEGRVRSAELADGEQDPAVGACLTAALRRLPVHADAAGGTRRFTLSRQLRVVEPRHDPSVPEPGIEIDRTFLEHPAVAACILDATATHGTSGTVHAELEVGATGRVRTVRVREDPGGGLEWCLQTAVLQLVLPPSAAPRSTVPITLQAVVPPMPTPVVVPLPQDPAP